MAREILFRGKRTGNGEWVEGHLIVYPKTKRTKILVWEWADLEFNAIEVRSETVGQYTGLTDKDGNRIFEGDIVERLGDKCIVRWIEKDAKFIIIGGMTKLDFSLFFAEHLEIIGNIHDNPELLNGTES